MALETKEVKYTKKVCFIDGIEFNSPSNFWEYLEIGLYGLFIIIFSPILLPFYLLGRIIKGISKEKNIDVIRKQLICPVCKTPTIYSDYDKLKCKSCDYKKNIETYY